MRAGWFYSEYSACWACQFTFFSAVQEMDAGTATIFQYLNPAMLILFFAVVYKIMPGKKEIAAVLAAISGLPSLRRTVIFRHWRFHRKGFYLACFWQ